MAHLYLTTLATKLKCVIDRWIALLIMEGDGCSLTFAKATNPYIIKAVAKSPTITHPSNQSDYTVDQEPKGVLLRKLTELASSTLWCERQQLFDQPCYWWRWLCLTCQSQVLVTKYLVLVTCLHVSFSSSKIFTKVTCLFMSCSLLLLLLLFSFSNLKWTIEVRLYARIPPRQWFSKPTTIGY